MEEDNNQNVKESFCPVCIAAVPLAFSVTTGVAAASEEDEYITLAHRRRIINWCTFIGLFSTFIIIYYMYYVKCQSCA